MNWKALTTRLRTAPATYLATRVLAIARARLLLRAADLGPRVGATGWLSAELLGRCIIGSQVTFRGGMIPTQLRVLPTGTLVIGAETNLNYGVSIEAHASVRIGARCMLASMVRICDLDRDGASPIVVGDDVWIAHGALLCPGVTVGDGAVVSAGSVVASDVPPRHLASGNPARAVPLALVAGRTSTPDRSHG